MCVFFNKCEQLVSALYGVIGDCAGAVALREATERTGHDRRLVLGAAVFVLGDSFLDVVVCHLQRYN